MTQEEKEKVAKQYACSHSTLGIDKETYMSEDTHMIPPQQMVRIPIYKTVETAVLFGLNYIEKNILKDAQGNDLPEINREVIVLCENEKVCYGHRPDPNGWDGKNIITGDVSHYTPQTYDNGGWNIPNVKWWFDIDVNELIKHN